MWHQFEKCILWSLYMYVDTSRCPVSLVCLHLSASSRYGLHGWLHWKISLLLLATLYLFILIHCSLCMCFCESRPPFEISHVFPLNGARMITVLCQSSQGCMSVLPQKVTCGCPNLSTSVCCLRPDGAVSLLCEHLHVQDSPAETGKEAVLEEPADLDLPLGMPPSFSDPNFQFYHRRIQVCLM